MAGRVWAVRLASVSASVAAALWAGTITETRGASAACVTDMDSWRTVPAAARATR